MNSQRGARDEILQRIRGATRDVPEHETPAAIPVERGYQRHDDTPHTAQVELFLERTADYQATVYHLSEAELPGQIAQCCGARGMRRMVVPADLPPAWLAAAREQGVDFVPDHALAPDELEACDGVLTGCALAIAQTGTIVLDSGPQQGRRIITLLPDYHLCIVPAEQIVGILPEAIDRLGPTVRDERRPLTFISGPSATSDIELNRVEGVHGPRTLYVLVVAHEP